MEHSACFIGHRTIEDTPLLRERVRGVLTELIEAGTVNFIFGDHSQFNSLCYAMITELKETIPAVRRIHFRKDYENAGAYTMRFLLSGYEDSLCPAGVGCAGKAGYVERNQAMIRESEVCVFYYDTTYQPPRRRRAKQDVSDYQPKSGTALAYAYAINQKKRVINVYDSTASIKSRER